jgi:hypothetical protein
MEMPLKSGIALATGGRRTGSKEARRSRNVGDFESGAVLSGQGAKQDRTKLRWTDARPQDKD